MCVCTFSHGLKRAAVSTAITDVLCGKSFESGSMQMYRLFLYHPDEETS